MLFNQFNLRFSIMKQNENNYTMGSFIVHIPLYLLPLFRIKINRSSICRFKPKYSIFPIILQHSLWDFFQLGKFCFEISSSNPLNLNSSSLKATPRRRIFSRSFVLGLRISTKIHEICKSSLLYHTNGFLGRMPKTGVMLHLG